MFDHPTIPRVGDVYQTVRSLDDRGIGKSHAAEGGKLLFLGRWRCLDGRRVLTVRLVFQRQHMLPFNPVNGHRDVERKSISVARPVRKMRRVVVNDEEPSVSERDCIDAGIRVRKLGRRERCPRPPFVRGPGHCDDTLFRSAERLDQAVRQDQNCWLDRLEPSAFIDGADDLPMVSGIARQFKMNAPGVMRLRARAGEPCSVSKNDGLILDRPEQTIRKSLRRAPRFAAVS